MDWVVPARLASAGLIALFVAVLLIGWSTPPAGTDAAPVDETAGPVPVGPSPAADARAGGAAVVHPPNRATPVSVPATGAVFGDSLAVEVGSALPAELGGGATASSRPTRGPPCVTTCPPSRKSPRRPGPPPSW